MMRIPLTKGKFAKVSDEDYTFLMNWKWYHVRMKDKEYAYRKEKGRSVPMHRELLKAQKGKVVDHINHNGLDNRRENLRVCTYSQNLMNMRKTRGSSKYKGVSFHKRAKKWMAYIKKGDRKHIGYFDDEISAAKAYNEEARRIFGRFALLNNI